MSHLLEAEEEILGEVQLCQCISDINIHLILEVTVVVCKKTCVEEAWRWTLSIISVNVSLTIWDGALPVGHIMQAIFFKLQKCRFHS